jgi:hypothetical protein
MIYGLYQLFIHQIPISTELKHKIKIGRTMRRKHELRFYDRAIPLAIVLFLIAQTAKAQTKIRNTTNHWQTR